MKTSDFSYHLPDELIAQYPAQQRDSSRLLCLDSSGDITDSTFKHFSSYLEPGDLIVLNDTRVIPARLFARKETGGKVEIMLERIRDEKTLLVQLRASKAAKSGTKLYLDETTYFEVLGRNDDMYLLVHDGGERITEILNRFGHMPLPPYITREDESNDQERYQTVFSEKPGAVAAPTAGLHFTQQIFDELTNKGINNVKLTLHVGAGTFQPVRVDDVANHQMHSEYACVSEDAVNKIHETKLNGGRVLAVGTTVVRSLETASITGELKSFEGDTDIFIYPGFTFNVVDMMLTNFHLSESTLLMLVSAFAGKENIMKAYQHAIEEKYRFYSYGDAMLITGKQ